MRPLRKRNPLLFDTAVLVMFVIIAFSASSLASAFGTSGAWAAISLLALLCVTLSISH